LAALKDDSEYVRRTAGSALGGTAGDPAVTAALLAALKDDSQYVRRTASSALSGAAGDPAVTVALLAALKHDSQYVRRGGRVSAGRVRWRSGGDRGVAGGDQG
jgi:HEAT repeat protein